MQRKVIINTILIVSHMIEIEICHNVYVTTNEPNYGEKLHTNTYMLGMQRYVVKFYMSQSIKSKECYQQSMQFYWFQISLKTRYVTLDMSHHI
jgi:hypothetical protein